MNIQKPILPPPIYYKDHLKPSKKKYNLLDLLKKSIANSINAMTHSAPSSEEVAASDLVLDSLLAAYPIHYSLQMINDVQESGSLPILSDSWHVDESLTQELAKGSVFEYNKNLKALHHKPSELILFLLRDTHAIRLVLGQTHWMDQNAHKKFSKPSLDFKSKFKKSKTLFPFTAIKDIINQFTQLIDPASLNEVKLLGLTSCGPLATYAALAQSIPLKAIVFASEPLPSRLVHELPSLHVKEAEQYITDVTIKGDIMPYLHPILESQGQHLGKPIAINPAHPYLLNRHQNMYKHLRYSSENNVKFKNRFL